MHTYRDALLKVRSAWVLYPGDCFAFYPLGHPIAERVLDVPIPVEGVGAVPLRPGEGAESALAVIRRMR